MRRRLEEGIKSNFDFVQSTIPHLAYKHSTIPVPYYLTVHSLPFQYYSKNNTCVLRHALSLLHCLQLCRRLSFECCKHCPLRNSINRQNVAMVTNCQEYLLDGLLTPSVKWEMGFFGVPQQQPARQSEHSHVCLHQRKSDVDGIIYREYTGKISIDLLDAVARFLHRPLEASSVTDQSTS